MRIPLTLLAGAVLALGACSDYSTGPGNSQPPTLTANVSVQDDQFVNASVRVLEGGTVTWTWQGANQHNVTFSGGGPVSATQTAGTFQRTFAQTGVFTYQCTVHGAAMSGTVTVEAPGTGTTYMAQ